ncbi:hypothetical protein LJC72_09750 [Bacteroides sp. OttesenSCG-928-D19]|nr:hypothetical protein [Bacteroides sp. OttesenSCG-928-D19]
MKALKLSCLLLFFINSLAWTQNDYFVKTSSHKSAATTEEERFVENNFPYISICNWTPGLRFMYMFEEKYGFIPTFSDYETEKPIENAFFQHKILTFLDVEDSTKDGRARNFIATRFIFELDGKKYYHEIKNQRLSDICLNSARASIKGLVFLQDIDLARKLLMGRYIYTKTRTVRVDDPNSANGYREMDIPINTGGRITAIGVGSREFPVKIVFDAENGRSYYAEVAFSTTNSGFVKSDFKGENLMKYFPNAFTFSNQDVAFVKDVKKQYLGEAVYPNRNLNATVDGRAAVLYRYTPLEIIDMTVDANRDNAVMIARDMNGKVYSVPIRLKYDIVIRNEDFIGDVFEQGNLRKKFPYISQQHWSLIINGDVVLGMTKDECRLSLGDPVQFTSNLNSRYETWFYNGKVLEFEDGKLIRVK